MKVTYLPGPESQAQRELDKLDPSTSGLNLDNGKEHGNYYSMMGYILGLYSDNGRLKGNDYLGFRV